MKRGDAKAESARITAVKPGSDMTSEQVYPAYWSLLN